MYACYGTPLSARCLAAAAVVRATRVPAVAGRVAAEIHKALRVRVQAAGAAPLWQLPVTHGLLPRNTHECHLASP